MVHQSGYVHISNSEVCIVAVASSWQKMWLLSWLPTLFTAPIVHMSVDPSRYHIFVSPYLGTGQLLGKKIISPPGGLEPPTFRLTAERASRLRHGGLCSKMLNMGFKKSCREKQPCSIFPYLVNWVFSQFSKEFVIGVLLKTSENL